MQIGTPMPRAWARAMILLLAARQGVAEDAGEIAADLRRISGELGESVKQFRKDLDLEIAQHDRGYVSAGGRRVPGADADLIAGPADVVLSTLQKLVTARMIAGRRPGYEPGALADCERIESLILQARDLVGEGNTAMKAFLVIPANELNSRADLEMRGQRAELAKARTLAMEAVRKAMAMLPVDVPDSSDDEADRTWSLTSLGLPVGKNDGTRVGVEAPLRAPVDISLPLRMETGKRLTLLYESSRRIELIDSGLEDGHGRRLFFQEEWTQRQGVTSLRRWAVALNTATGQHELLRRNTIREFSGELDDAYEAHARDYVTRGGVAGTLPAGDLAAAAAATARLRQGLQDGLASFRARIRESLERSDRLLAEQNKTALDDELPGAIRESLFAIRAHLARVPFVLDGEEKVRRAMEEAGRSAGALEAMAAWTGGDGIEGVDKEIDLTRSVESEARAALPPDVSKPDARFPAFMKDVIVRLRGQGSPSEKGTVKCRQEVWRFDTSGKLGRRVRRTIAFIDIEPKTGNQDRTGVEVRYYPATLNDTLESIFDENAAH